MGRYSRIVEIEAKVGVSNILTLLKLLALLPGAYFFLFFSFFFFNKLTSIVEEVGWISA